MGVFLWRIHRVWPAFLIVIGLMSAGCDPAGEPESAQGLTLSASQEVELFWGKTTAGEIAVGNLSSEIAAREFSLTLTPQNLWIREALIDLLLMRSQVLGTFSDLDRALELAERGQDLHPDDGDAALLMARVLAAVHRFFEAEEWLEQAIGLGAAHPQRLMDTIDLAQGENLDEILGRRLQWVKTHSSYEAWTDLAAIQAAHGLFEEADASFRVALDSYDDVSPFPVAWVAFQRGVMWAEQADVSVKAVALYREAVQRLPQFVVAQVHLSELEAESGEFEAAEQRLRGLVQQTEDPEPLGRLAELLAEAFPTEAGALVDEARVRYEDLFERHPQAFLDHGAEFFMGPGQDPDRAVSLAMAQLSHRQNDRAYLVALRSALAAEEPELACELVTDAGPERANVILNALLRVVSEGCP